MTICYFGNYDPDYSRNKILIRGLKANGAAVLQCNDRSPGLKKYLNLIKAHRSLAGKYDAMVIGYSVQGGRFLVMLARVLTRKPIVWDALFSLYDNWIFDRKLASPHSLKAFYYWFLDWICCQAADLVILDTDANIDYFIKTFRVKRDKFARILVGADDEVLKPKDIKKGNSEFIVEFHGHYIPVQGAENIILAANILRNENIKFYLIGKGQEYKKIEQMVKETALANVILIPTVPFVELAVYLEKADVAMGLLGDVPRVNRAIPNKVYEAAASQRASISADTDAIKEVFKDRESILLCRPGDPKDLAEKIMELKNNPELKEKISRNAYLAFQKAARSELLGNIFLEKINALVKNQRG